MAKQSDDNNYAVEFIGKERQPIVIVDDFSSNFAEILTAAKSANFAESAGHYPGVRAPAPASYLGERSDVLKAILIDVFGMQQGATLVECNFSMVTTRPSELTVIQRLPHFDGADDKRLALLHYCNDNAKGGTAFFRHRATGFETISKQRLAVYEAALREEIETNGAPEPQYFSGSNEQFEELVRIDAKPNRMIIYRGIVLHSGIVGDEAALGENALSPRLTINTFLSARA